MIGSELVQTIDFVPDRTILSETIDRWPYEVHEGLKFHVSLLPENDGSVTGTIDELDLIENAKTQEGCIALLLSAMRDYARDFYREFELWGSAPNRRGHIPYVLKILSSSDVQLMEDVVCRDGRI